MPNILKRIIERIYGYFSSRFLGYGIEITSPPDDRKFEPGVPIELKASRHRGLNPSGHITWISSIDGTLGTGDALTIPDPSVGRVPLRLGQHVIRAEHPSILGGYTWSDKISLTVTPCLKFGDYYYVAPNGIPRLVRVNYTGDKHLDVPYYFAPNGILRFVSVNYIELDKIRRISKFRSGVGHDCSDSFEKQRNMKHYFEPLGDQASEVKIFAPVTGKVRIRPTQAGGDKVEIIWESCPRIVIAIHHVKLANEFVNSLDIEQPGVVAGQQLGTHIGTQTKSDIEVVVYFENGWQQRISYFDVMTDSLFQEYLAQDYQTHEKKNSRDDFIISEKVRDYHPLDPDDTKWREGSTEDWVTLR